MSGRTLGKNSRHRLADLILLLAGRLARLDWLLLLLLTGIAAFGVLGLYSASSSWSPWAARHAIRFGMALLLAIGVAMVNPGFWFRHAYLVWCLAVLALLAVTVAGETRMGAQRWIGVGDLSFQPSELAKLAIILALARLFHDLPPTATSRLPGLPGGLFLLLVPTLLVLRQPDLGTALLMLAAGGAMFLYAGLSLVLVAVVVLLAGGLVMAMLVAPDIRRLFLHDYQWQRIQTFLNPEQDPSGAGYHILQSKIALGSGGTHGKGLMRGTQVHLEFLPESTTDFIFAALAEEIGFAGVMALILLFMAVFLRGHLVALRIGSRFGQLLAGGTMALLFTCFAVNIGMVLGLLPVVGVPLPLVSWGGTSMFTVMLGIGLFMGARLHAHAGPVSGAGLAGRHGSG